MNWSNENWCIFGLSKSEELAKKISEISKIPHYEIKTHQFGDGEFLVKPVQSVRGRDVIIVQSTATPVNDSLMELLIAIDAIKQAAAKSILVLIPYFGYSRQDRKTSPREPITSRLVAHMIQTAGATKVVTVDIHSHPTVGYFDIPVENISLIPLFTDTICDIVLDKYPDTGITLVSPDYGGVTRVRRAARMLGALDPQVAIIDKRRPEPNSSEVVHVLGDVTGRVCFVIDDIIDTGGTICKGAQKLMENGAKAVYVLASHGILSGQACANLERSVAQGDIKKVIISNTIEQNSMKSSMPGLEIKPTAEILADFIRTLINDQSISQFYKDYHDKMTKKLINRNKK